MRVRTGTSGFAYLEWRGTFYPPYLKPEERLAFYASQLEAVELNNTFYRMPRPSMLAHWASQVPEDFVFAVKAPQVITHRERLAPGTPALERFLDSLASLGRKLGPVLFQLPPSFKLDEVLLREFLASLPPRLEAAFEFRHSSWMVEEVQAALAERGAALCLTETDANPGVRWPTARFGYLRLRRSSYDEVDLARWAHRLIGQPWESACVFFKHAESRFGPIWARALANQLRAIEAEAITPAP